jgi:hypothetical protein
VKSDLDMTAQQLYQRKLKLERDISALVRAFHAETGIEPRLRHGPIRVQETPRLARAPNARSRPGS